MTDEAFVFPIFAYYLRLCRHLAVFLSCKLIPRRNAVNTMTSYQTLNCKSLVCPCALPGNLLLNKVIFKCCDYVNKASDANHC